MRKKKLELKKKVIATLSEAQKSKIIGGDDTTSYEMCETMATACGDDSCGPDCTQTCPTGDPVACITYNC